MNKALFVIDVTDFYLSEYQANGNYTQEISVFIKNVVDRAWKATNEVVLFFSDLYSALYPDVFSDLIKIHSPIRYKDEFSAFDYIPVEESELHRFLQEQNVDELEICGLYAHWCVAATVEDALELGYKVRLNPHLILDEDGTINPDLSSMTEKGALLL